METFTSRKVPNMYYVAFVNAIFAVTLTKKRGSNALIA